MQYAFAPSLLQLTHRQAQFSLGDSRVLGFGCGDHFLDGCFQAGFYGLIPVVSLYALLIAFLF
jgi:hypothetical protein